MAMRGSRSGAASSELKCSKCAYNLMGTASTVCPECGASVLESVEVRDREAGIDLRAIKPVMRPWSSRGTPPWLGVLMGGGIGALGVVMSCRALGGERLESLARHSHRLMSPMEGAITYGAVAAVGSAVAVSAVLYIVRARRAMRE